MRYLSRVVPVVLALTIALCLSCADARPPVTLSVPSEPSVRPAVFASRELDADSNKIDDEIDAALQTLKSSIATAPGTAERAALQAKLDQPIPVETHLFQPDHAETNRRFHCARREYRLYISGGKLRLGRKSTPSSCRATAGTNG